MFLSAFFFVMVKDCLHQEQGVAGKPFFSPFDSPVPGRCFCCSLEPGGFWKFHLLMLKVSSNTFQGIPTNAYKGWWIDKSVTEPFDTQTGRARFISGFLFLKFMFCAKLHLEREKEATSLLNVMIRLRIKE